MKIFRTLQELRQWRQETTGTVGFVPTMGALHAGHGELLKQARKQNDFVVLSIFVNPTQFNNPSDFEKYPSTWEDDVALAKSFGVDVILSPPREDLYPDGYTYRVSEKDFSTILEGEFRPGHFDGVLTIVLKLFQLVKPTKAYFGEKDFQQLALIQGMAKAFFLDLEIVPVATVREESGLAMSSRNLRLTAEQRNQAAAIHRSLISAASAAEAQRQLEADGFKVEYVQDCQGRRLVAAFLGEVRLIDNVTI